MSWANRPRATASTTADAYPLRTDCLPLSNHRASGSPPLVAPTNRAIRRSPSVRGRCGRDSQVRVAQPDTERHRAAAIEQSRPLTAPGSCGRSLTDSLQPRRHSSFHQGNACSLDAPAVAPTRPLAPEAPLDSHRCTPPLRLGTVNAFGFILASSATRRVQPVSVLDRGSSREIRSISAEPWPPCLRYHPLFRVARNFRTPMRLWVDA